MEGWGSGAVWQRDSDEKNIARRDVYIGVSLIIRASALFGLSLKGERNFVFLRGQHDFKIQLPLYFLQPDWLIRSFSI